MKAVEYLVETLIQYGVTDVFGIPGGVVLDLLYALDAKKPIIIPHLSYHEQAAGFASSGYAQVKGTLGVAYATRGPGFTNLLTPMADAWQESIPVLFITAHTEKIVDQYMRMSMDQEMDTIPIVRTITKYAARIDKIEDFVEKVETACKTALDGRKGPVFLDINKTLWECDITYNTTKVDVKQSSHVQISQPYEKIYGSINTAMRPIILVGDGVHQASVDQQVAFFAKEKKIPILSSRCSQDLFSDSSMYFGYIGSHGLRYSNFILSKADLIIALGNRMSFPLNSKSFAPIFKNAKTIRVDIDDTEFRRMIPNCIEFKMNLKDFFAALDDKRVIPKQDEWFSVCKKLKATLCNYDIDYPVSTIANILKQLPPDYSIVSDVGNNEFWLSQAYSYSAIHNRTLYSRSFGTMGCALPKSIGVYFQTKKPVLCVVGDQGLQMNIQELLFIAENNLPIMILLLNNHISGMIRDHERKRFGDYFLHSTNNNGYHTPAYQYTTEIFGIDYRKVQKNAIIDFSRIASPTLLELEIDSNIELLPYLPNGNPCQDLVPSLEY